jgi:hypothetical protein
VTAVNARRDQLERPFRVDHELRNAELAVTRAAMPKDLPALLRWFEELWALEIPEELHSSAIWRDRVSPSELKAGVRPVGSSETGALAYADEFRRRLENGPSEVDGADPATAGSGRVYYARPIAAALSRISRKGKPLMARTLIAIGLAGFDWRAVADRGSWPHEMFEVYARESLIRLWFEHREWVRSD